jgi:hypothetical protein
LVIFGIYDNEPNDGEGGECLRRYPTVLGGLYTDVFGVDIKVRPTVEASCHVEVTMMQRTLAVATSAAYLYTAALWGQPPAAPLGDSPTCGYDRQALLQLDQRAFDQDMNGGWRALARRDECIGVAADLIRQYREAQDTNPLMLYWHEGQLRATIGQTEQAIALFEQSREVRDAPPAAKLYVEAWNLYVQATIAFLRQDQPALVRARESLAALPLPEEFSPPTPQLQWPLNLNVVDMLVACFGRPYKEAYGRCAQVRPN